MADLTERLRGLDEGQVAAYFTGADAVEVTDTIRATSDDALRALLSDPATREVAVGALLRRFAEFADATRLATVQGTAAFVLGGGRGCGVERHVLRFAGGTVEVDDAAAPDVTIAAALLDFVRLVTGQRNAALLYLAGELAIEGDERLALDVGSVFRLPGSDQVAVDPTALDPVDVATAVKHAPREHLDTVMAGQLRALVVEEVFRRMPDFVDDRKARALQVAVGFRIDGRPDGDADRYVVRLADGACTVLPDPDSEIPRDATLMLDGAGFVELVTGQLNPVGALLKGRLRVRGDRAKALAFHAAMSPPRPRG